MTIQWFPGHMAKAKRKVLEKLKLIDVVIELLDARLPLASRNPMIDEIVQNKPRLLLLNKSDLADPRVTDEWLAYFAKRGMTTRAIDAQAGKGIAEIPRLCQELAAEMFAKREARGMKPRAVRAMILGIPNVGKSSLINRLAKRSVAQTGDRPAVTKGQQWVRVGHTMELLDTPGILWPKFEDRLVGLKLAASGAIKDEVLDFQEVAVFVADFLKDHYAERLRERYKLTDIPEDKVALLEAIGRKRGCLVAGGRVDFDKASELLLREVRAGKLGPISFERPEGDPS
ncbi:ribosome biogenesis GTPase YlqF [Bacillaceae bacterium]